MFVGHTSREWDGGKEKAALPYNRKPTEKHKWNKGRITF